MKINLNLIISFFIGIALTILSVVWLYLTPQTCKSCAAISLWPGNFVAYLTWPLCAHTGVICFYLGLVISVPIYGFAAYIFVRLFRKYSGLESRGEA